MPRRLPFPGDYSRETLHRFDYRHSCSNRDLQASRLFTKSGLNFIAWSSDVFSTLPPPFSNTRAMTHNIEGTSYLHPIPPFCHVDLSATASVGNLCHVSYEIRGRRVVLTHLQSLGNQPVQGHSIHGVRVVAPSASRLAFIERSKVA